MNHVLVRDGPRTFLMLRRDGKMNIKSIGNNGVDRGPLRTSAATITPTDSTADRELLADIGEAVQHLDSAIRRTAGALHPQDAERIRQRMDVIIDSLEAWFVAHHPGERPSFLCRTWRTREAPVLPPDAPDAADGDVVPVVGVGVSNVSG